MSRTTWHTLKIPFLLFRHPSIVILSTSKWWEWILVGTNKIQQMFLVLSNSYISVKFGIEYSSIVITFHLANISLQISSTINMKEKNKITVFLRTCIFLFCLINLEKRKYFGTFSRFFLVSFSITIVSNS